MQYLLMDTHRRCLGMLSSQKELSVGDTFKDTSAKTYAVIGFDWSGINPSEAHSLVVIPVNTLPERIKAN